MEKKQNIPTEKLKSWGSLVRFRKGEFLFHAQDKARRFYYLQSGEIRVFKMDREGKEVEIVRLKPGEFLAEAVAFASSVFPAYAQAVKDSEVLYFETNTVFKYLEKDPLMARFFIKLLAKKCLTLNERIEILGLMTVRQRFIRYLLSCSQGNISCQLDLDIKKSDLARQLGTVSETLSRTLRDLKKEGLIEVRGRTILIKDCRSLRNIFIG